jgi:RNA polymerase sigma-70 factor, ECF subfamily
MSKMETDEFLQDLTDPDRLRRLQGSARGLTQNSDAAKDLLQQTLLRAIENRNLFCEERGGLDAWLYRMMRNVHITNHRRATSRRTTAETASYLQGRTAMPNQEAAVMVGEVWDHIGLLSDDSKKVIILRGVLDQSVAAAAQTLGVPPGTVKSRLNQARKKLCERFAIQELT